LSGIKQGLNFSDNGFILTFSTIWSW
jgi:hypothetical protein